MNSGGDGMGIIRFAYGNLLLDSEIVDLGKRDLGRNCFGGQGKAFRAEVFFQAFDYVAELLFEFFLFYFAAVFLFLKADDAAVLEFKQGILCRKV